MINQDDKAQQGRTMPQMIHPMVLSRRALADFPRI
jgi:hypothetical protein